MFLYLQMLIEIIHTFVVYEEGRFPGIMLLRRLTGKVLAIVAVREYTVFSM